MSITNWGKAVDVLRNAGFDIEKMKNGNVAKYQLSEQGIQNIIVGEKYNSLAALNKAGQLLKKSKFTRLTTHKTYDFSVLQSQSNLNHQVFIKNLQEIINQDNDVSLDGIDEKLKKEIYTNGSKLLKEVERELKRASDILKNDKEYKEKMKEFNKKSIGEKYQMLEEAFKILHEDYGLNDAIRLCEPQDQPSKEEQNRSSSSDSRRNKKALIAGGIFVAQGLVSIATWSLTGILSLNVLMVVPAAIPIAAGLILLGLGSVKAYNTYRSKTRLKREFVQARDHVAKAVKKLNALAKYVKHELECGKNLETTKASGRNAETEKLITDYLEKQKALWKPYTTAEGREYAKSGVNDTVKERHYTAGRRVSDSKQDRHGYQGRLGRLKLAVARQWCEISVT